MSKDDATYPTCINAIALFLCPVTLQNLFKSNFGQLCNRVYPSSQSSTLVPCSTSRRKNCRTLHFKMSRKSTRKPPKPKNQGLKHCKADSPQSIKERKLRDAADRTLHQTRTPQCTRSLALRNFQIFESHTRKLPKTSKSGSHKW